MNQFLKFTFICAGLTAIMGCTNNEQDETLNDVTPSDVAVDTNDTRVSENIDFMLPQPFALISSFERAGMEFESTRMNPPQNVDNYLTEGKQLLNFGVYSADLVYSIINDQTQASINNFNAIKKLGDQLGMNSIFNEEDLAQEIEENIANRSEMERLLIDVHEKSQEHLASNKLKKLAAVQFSGAWIEGMYLATFDLDDKDSLLLSNNIVDHMTLLKNVIKAIDVYAQQKDELTELLAALQELESAYKNLDSINNTQDFPELNREEIKSIAKKIHTIRELVIA